MAMNLQSTQMLVPGTGMLPDRNGRYPPVEVGGGNKYTGDWHRGSMHGKGEYEFADGRRYEGEFRDGLMQGQCKFTWPSGHRYEGEWLEYDMHGRGSFTSNKRWCFAGVLERDRPTHGVLTEADGGCFMVSYSKTCDSIFSKPKPKRKVRMPAHSAEDARKERSDAADPHAIQDSQVRPRTAPEIGFREFCGCWVQVQGDMQSRFRKKTLPPSLRPFSSLPLLPSRPHEKIQQRDANADTRGGNASRANLRNRRMPAKATETSPREAHFRAFENGGTYTSEWMAANGRHGKGTLIYSDGDRYVGEFWRGKKHGHGTFTWTDGSRYEGNWKANMMHGKGTFWRSDGRSFFEGVFHMGAPTQGVLERKRERGGGGEREGRGGREREISRETGGSSLQVVNVGEPLQG